ncbi:metalloregulator ArsR/SmtB family transcription factor [Clostridium ihumii]|uniref:DUF2087 domain-containing protein n=1 Tax=Clostridium ihumii TaxID=1470356 RepID=UPI003D33632B
MDIDCIKIFKCLSDKSRLLIIDNLSKSPMYVELLAERLDLSASTVSFHLKKLEDAKLVSSTKEQYYTLYHLNSTILALSLNDVINMNTFESDIQIKRENEYKNNVLNSFFEYGKLKSIPVQQKKRKIILEEIGKNFFPNKKYTEKEVNLILADFYDDFCTLRRGLIEEKILKRENNIYELN